jgi:hypothetical protein
VQCQDLRHAERTRAHIEAYERRGGKTHLPATGVGNANRVLRLCLEERFRPLTGAALLAEYEDLLRRGLIWRGARLTAAEREAFLDIFLLGTRCADIRHVLLYSA